MRDMTIRAAVTEVRGVKIIFTTNSHNDLLVVVDGKYYDIPLSDARKLPDIVGQWLRDHEIRKVVGEMGNDSEN